MKRSAPIAAIVAVAGCNQIFGLDATKQQDALVPVDFILEGPGDDASMFTFGRATLLVLDGPVAYPESSAITLQAGPMADRAMLMPLAFTADRVDRPTGEFGVPNDLVDEPWRLLATFPKADGTGTIVHEYQWKPPPGFHVTAPMRVGHGAPAAVPPGSGFAITPAGVGHPIARPELITSGVWTNTRRLPPSATFGIDWPTIANESDALVGPLGAPETSRGDWQLLHERGTVDTCLATIGAAYQDDKNLAAGAATPSMPPWVTTTTSWVPPTYASALATIARFTQQVTNPSGTAPTERSVHGYVPKDGMPSFARRRRRVDVSDLRTDRPVMVALAECTTLRSTPIDVVLHPQLPMKMTKANYVEFALERTVSSTIFYSSLQAIALGDGALEPKAPFAGIIVFDSNDMRVTPDFTWTIPVAAPRFIPLTWTPETGGAVMPADDWEVTLYALGSTEPRAIRVFHVTQPSVQVDTAAFDGVPGTEFIWKITSRKGAPGAGVGKFDTFSYPYSSASQFTLGFRISR